jgi:sugar lactone lactonase YvrE
MKTALTLLLINICILIQAQTLEQFNSDQVIHDLVLFEGQLWLASESGILAFDTLGNEVRRYNLTNGVGDYSSEFSSIGIANNGTLYVSKNGILGKTWEYNSLTSSWTKLSIGKSNFVNDEICYSSYKYFHHSTTNKKAKTVLPFFLLHQFCYCRPQQ